MSSVSQHAEALARIHAIIEQKKGQHILHTSEISRSDREILTHTNWLQEIISGWYLVVRPDVLPGDTTAWFANFWDFIQCYLEYHYKKEYCLSAESSLDLQLGATQIPKQIIVMAKGGSGKPLKLPYDTSLLVYKDPSRLPDEYETIRGLQVLPLVYALCKVSPKFFINQPRDAEIALQSILDPTALIRTIVKNEFKAAAGRFIGAYRFLGNVEFANKIQKGLADVGILVQETNPFIHAEPFISGRGRKSPYVTRITAMWSEFRLPVIDCFPEPLGIPKNTKDYFNLITQNYAQDAYNSLSIEGYQVSESLVQRVKSAKWNPDLNQEDREKQNILAARGYYDAFEEVKSSIIKIFRKETPGHVVEQDLQAWYQKLFSPSVNAGIINREDLFGFRQHQVYIRNSRHTPPAEDYLGELMEAFFQCLINEPHAAVRAILGHFIFVFIHPYMDGNGRLARFLMNVMFASGGYPWTIVQAIHRNQYFTSLEKASVHGDIVPFTKFILSEMKRPLA